jgi:hypothetical protein
MKVLALNETYLVYQTDQGVMLVHVRRQAEEKDKIESRPAAELLAELVERAKELNGTLR